MDNHSAVVGAVLWVAVAFTIVTGIQYLIDGRRALRSAGSGSRGVSPHTVKPSTVAPGR
jgi:hypothetical protein